MNLSSSAKFQRWATLILIAIFFSSLASAVAEAQVCADLFRDQNQVSAGRAYRKQLTERAHWILADLRKSADAQMDIASRFLERRSDVTSGSIRLAIQSSKTLSNAKMRLDFEPGQAESVLPPDIFPHTILALEDPALNEAYLDRILSADPYFAWLKHNALPFKIAPNRNRTFVQEQLRVGDFQPTPIQLFTKYRKQGLSPELSLLRVQRNLDPDLSSGARLAIDRALVLTARINAIEDQLFPRLTGPSSDGAVEAWYEMTSLKAGRLALNEMRNRLVIRHGSQFSEVAFQRLLIMFRRYDPSTFVVEKFRIQRVLGLSDSEILEMFKLEIAALRERLQVGGEISDIRLLEVSQRAQALRYESSYAFVLADVFESPVGTTPPPNQPANIVSSQLLNLHKLIEIGEGLQSPRNWAKFIEEMGRENESRFLN
ncbi:hypothetical protein BH10BDE1_BH10BDE1_15230 [soil metagenome]